MNKPKHTPGPWKQGDSNDKRLGGYIRSEARQLAVAEVMRGKSLDEFEANAALIAAAPKMLEALKACLPSHREGDCYSNDYMGVCVCGRDKALAVIAKAEGGSK